MTADVSSRADSVRKYSTWFIIYGVLLIVLGALAIFAPGLASLVATAFLGWVLLVSGIIGIVSAFGAGASAPGFWWHLLTAIVYALAGLALVFNPIAGALTLTIVLAAYLVASGVTKIVLALGYRRSIPRSWGWMLLSALIDIVLGLLIFSGWPGDAIWIMGLMIGINLVFTGVAEAAAGLYGRRLASG